MYNQYDPYQQMQAQLQQQYNARLAQLQQQYPQYSQQFQQAQMPVQQPQQPQSVAFRCMPVSSIDEARAVIADPMGAPTVFVDEGNHKVYTKQIGTDGTAKFRVYAMEEQPVAATPAPEAPAQGKQYLEVESFINYYDELKQEIAALREEKANGLDATAPANTAKSKPSGNAKAGADS